MVGEIAIGYGVASVATFGENLKRLRVRAGYRTARALAATIGVTPPVISKMENDLQGLPEGPTLLRLAKTLDCTIGDLLDGIDEEYDEITQRARLLASQSNARLVMQADILLGTLERKGLNSNDIEALRGALDEVRSATDQNRHDLGRHGTGARSRTSTGGPIDELPASARRQLTDLNARLKTYETALAQVQDVASRLVKIAVAARSAKSGAPVRREPGRGGSHRKTG